MDGVLALGLERYPELGSLAINRAEMLIAAGRDREAVDALADLDAHHADKLSPYGQMWVWANRACALRGAGRVGEAGSFDEKITAKPGDNWSAATVAAACRGDSKAIADMLIVRLSKSDDRPAALGLFIVFEAREARTPVEIAMREAMARARQAPAVQAEFAKYGRSVRYAGTAQGWSEF